MKKLNILITIILCICLLSSCVFTVPENPGDTDKEQSGSDVGGDVGEDVGGDVGGDVGEDVGGDVGEDVSEDVSEDVGGDISGDVSEDVGGDVGGDGDITVEGQLQVHFIDVGQGDCTVIVLPDGKTMLIDAARREYGDRIVNYVKALEITKLDYVVATHPHDDHIGSMAKVINSFDIGEIYMPRVSHTISDFENMLLAIQGKGLGIKTAKAGAVIFESGSLKAQIIAPANEEYDGLNNYSACVMLYYGEHSFLFTGDAESELESEILSGAYADVSADVVKVAHHGSTSSSTKRFVEATGAEYAVISVGENDYGHPKKEVIDRWESIGATVLRTDILSTVVFTSDGNELSYSSVKMPMQEGSDNNDGAPSEDVKSYSWVLNTNTKKIHYPHCSSAKKISESNIGYSESSVSELIGEGYSPCGNCNPAD